jgi:hypothetical protein
MQRSKRLSTTLPPGKYLGFGNTIIQIDHIQANPVGRPKKRKAEDRDHQPPAPEDQLLTELDRTQPVNESQNAVSAVPAIPTEQDAGVVADLAEDDSTEPPQKKQKISRLTERCQALHEWAAERGLYHKKGRCVCLWCTDKEQTTITVCASSNALARHAETQRHLVRSYRTTN